MRPLSVLIFFLFAVVSCNLSPSEYDEVNTDRALRHRVRESAIIDKVEVMPLLPQIDEELCLTTCEVTDEAVFLVNSSKDRIIAFSILDGSELFSVGIPREITDYSVSDMYLDVLSDRGVFSFDKKNGSFISEVHLKDTAVTLTCIARGESDYFVFHGYDESSVYFCEYNIKDNYFAVVPYPSPVSTDNVYDVIENTRFFRCDNVLYAFYSDSGDIWRCATFNSPHCLWKFDSLPNTFTNAQKTAGNIYLSYVSDSSYYTLICNEKSRRYKIVGETNSGKTFPLGTIYNNVNYCVRPNGQIDKYMGIDSAIGTVGDEAPVLIKYYLP